MFSQIFCFWEIPDTSSDPANSAIIHNTSSLIHCFRLQTKLPLGLKSGDVGSPLDTLALLNCCCSSRILGATGAAAAEAAEAVDANECGGCEWMSTAAVTTDDRGCPPYPYRSPPGGATEEAGAPHRLSGLP